MTLPRLRSAALLACLVSACAHPVAPSQDNAVPTPPQPRYPGLHMQDEVPDMSPELMGRRFLQLVDSLQRYEQLTFDHVQQVTGLTLVGERGYPGPQFNVRMPDSRWHYRLGFSENQSNPDRTMVELDFLHREDPSVVDMAPVCALDFDAYHRALLAMGFHVREDMVSYELQHYVPLMNAQGETEYHLLPAQPRPLPYVHYSRGDVGINLSYRRGGAHVGSERRSCVLRIGVGKSSVPQP